MKSGCVSYTLMLVGLCCFMGCGDDGSGPGPNNNQVQTDAGVDAEVQNDAEVINDPLCPLGQQCTEVTQAGRLGCLQGDEIPPGAPTDCLSSGCDGNTRCTYTDETETTTACTENCGECPGNSVCSNIVDGYRGCLVNGEFPTTVQTGCYDGAPCEGNTTCWYYSNTDPIQSFCVPNCSACREGTCPAGEICGPEGSCIPTPCSEGSCGVGEICWAGTCIPDIGDGPGAGPGPSCNLPPLNCTDTPTACGELIQFDPTNLPTDGNFDPLLGYADYAENGETVADQYRSWLRRDVVMVIQYAAAKVACKAQNWTFGNGGVVGLIDMSEENGAIPGTSIGSPGHPNGTHTNGFQIDIAYFQSGTADNRARPVCDHYDGGAEAYHCTAPPHLLDPWRTGLFIGAILEHQGVRVIGVDGKVGPMLEHAMSILCDDGWMSGAGCGAYAITFEETDQGGGWYTFHHHHMHVDLSFVAALPKISSESCLIRGCEAAPLREFLQRHGITSVATPYLTPLRK
ncbi:MAG: hypothetical protein ABI333_09980 [bacterium]